MEEEKKSDKETKKESFIKKHERALSFIAFVLGFIWDGITLKYVSLPEAGLILGGYLFLIAVSVVIFNRLKSKISLGFIKDKITKLIPYFIQFLFGTLFNAAFLFYFQSAELHTSWPFLVFIALVLFSNELFRKYHALLYFQIIMFFIASYLYFVFVMPIVLGKTNTEIFLLSGATSLVINFILMAILSIFAKKRFLHRHILMTVIILIIYAGFNFLYFSKIIPPIPLALKSADIFHYVEKKSDKYIVSYESAQSSFWNFGKKQIHLKESAPIYVFTAVFAPATISTQIYHEWWYFDEKDSNWKLKSKIKFPIIGGRSGGYRGYSIHRDLEGGEWRVYVTTENGNKLGRVNFEVVISDKVPILTKDYR